SWSCRRCRRSSWIAEKRRGPQRLPCRRNRDRKSALTKEMRLRLVLSSIVLAALAANPCFAKDGHTHHGARARAANHGASGNGASGGSRAPSKAVVPIDAEAPIAPPVLPPRGVTQEKIRTINPSVKTVNPRNSSRSQTGATTITAPASRNAIGQPVV